ncbi:MAG: alpha/beta hydrolase [candidate division Zixibacteria bacterium]|nr:alpha/beta hydrolase [candidate division Zixibacteria bacterium]
MRVIQVCFVFLIMVSTAFCNDVITTGNYVNINEIEIYYEIHGEGEPILMLHGGLGSSVSLEKQVNHFEKNYMVITPDSRGHGRTIDGKQPITYELMADDMIKLINHLSIDSFCVIGMSDGGNIGLILSNKYPQRVKKLVTDGTNFQSNCLTQEFIDFISNATPESLAEVMEPYNKLNPDPDHWPVFFNKIKELWLNGIILEKDQLAKIEAKSLIIVGDNDIIPIEHSTELYNSIPCAQMWVMPGTGHGVYSAQPDLFNQIVGDFMR